MRCSRLVTHLDLWLQRWEYGEVAQETILAAMLGLGVEAEIADDPVGLNYVDVAWRYLLLPYGRKAERMVA